MKQLIFILLLISCSQEIQKDLEVEEEFPSSFYNSICLNHGELSNRKYMFSHIDKDNVVICKPVMVYDPSIQKEIQAYRPKDALFQTMEFQRKRDEASKSEENE